MFSSLLLERPNRYCVHDQALHVSPKSHHQSGEYGTDARALKSLPHGGGKG